MYFKMKFTRIFFTSLFLLSSLFFFGQSARKPAPAKKILKPFVLEEHPDYQKINDSLPRLIPQKKEGKFGFINQEGKVIIPHLYSNVGFYTEDCTLLNSPKEEVRKYGSDQYSSVRYNGVDYRIDYQGKRVYNYKDEEIGKCPFVYKEQKYHSYIRQGYYGVIDRKKFFDETDYRQFIIYPQYQYLHILEGDDLEHPMIVAAHDNRFGIIDIEGKVVVPLRFADIKRNFSWKLGRLFEVSDDGKNYYFIDQYGNRY